MAGPTSKTAKPATKETSAEHAGQMPDKPTIDAPKAKPTTDAPKPSAEHETSDIKPESDKAAESCSALPTSPKDNDSPIYNILNQMNC